MTSSSNHYGPYPAVPTGNMDSSPGGLGILDIVRIMRMRWWLVLLGLGAAVGAAWYIVPPDRSYYNATAVVRIEDTRGDVTAGLAGSQGDVRSAEFMLSQQHVIRSNNLIGEVVDQARARFWPASELPLSLVANVEIFADPEFSGLFYIRLERQGFTVVEPGTGQLVGRYGEPITVAGTRFVLTGPPPAELNEVAVRVLSRQEAIALVAANVRAQPRNRAAVLDITYQHADPTRARTVVNAVADAYQAYNASNIQDRARNRREFLQEQLLEAEGTLARNQQVLREFQEADRTFGSRERLQAERTTLLTLDSQRRQLEEERRVYQSFLDRVGRATDEQIDLELRTLMAAPGVATGPILSQLYGELTSYQLERERLIASGQATSNPDVRQLTTLIDARRNSIADAARTQVASLDLRIATIDDQRVRTAAALRSLPETGAEEVRLLQEIESARATLSALQGEFQRARLAETLDVSQVQILDYATFATPVVVGTRVRSLLIAVVFGFLLGGGGALVLEITNKSVRGRNELETLLAVPGLGTIPKILSPGPNGSRGRILARKASSANGDGDHALYVGRVSPPNGTTTSPSFRGSMQEFHSMAAEAYRLLRTNLVFLTPEEDLRTLVVTSASSGDGKTTTAANLAVAFARQGKRVLLVDCDLRRPRLHTLFGVPRSPGFTDLLLGNVSGNRAIRQTAIERLSLLPRGEFDERAAEMLSGTMGRNVIAKLREHWDLVIFDTSPVLLTADAAAVAPNVDGVLLVVRAGRTSRDAARHAVQQLNVVGSQILGFVLNDPESVGDKYGEYKYVKEYYAVEA